MPLLRQETITQMTRDFGDEVGDSDVENERLSGDDEEAEEERRRRERRKRRRTMGDSDVENEEDAEERNRRERRERRRTTGDSPANRAPLSSWETQKTLTQMPWLKRGSEWEWEGSDEDDDGDGSKGGVNPGEEITIFQDGTASLVTATPAGAEYGERFKEEFEVFEDLGDGGGEGRFRGDCVLQIQLEMDHNDEESAVRSRRGDREVGDSDEEEESELEDEEGDVSRLEARPELGYGEEFEKIPDSGGQRYAMDEEDEQPAPDEEPLVVREEEVGDADEDPNDENIKQEYSYSTNQLHMPSSPPTAITSHAVQIQVRSSLQPTTLQKKRYEIPDSDADSDFSPEKAPRATLVTSPLVSSQSTPSRRAPFLPKYKESSPFLKSVVSQSPIAKAPSPIPPSQATKVNRTQYMQSQIISATQKTPTRKTKPSREPKTKISPFVLRSSQLLTESQMLPASLMDTMPLPPRWAVSDDEEDEEDGNVDLDD